MQHLISGSLAAMGQLVYKRVILAVTILFCVGVAVAMTNMSKLSSTLKRLILAICKTLILCPSGFCHF